MLKIPVPGTAQIQNHQCNYLKIMDFFLTDVWITPNEGCFFLFFFPRLNFTNNMNFGDMNRERWLAKT